MRAVLYICILTLMAACTPDKLDNNAVLVVNGKELKKSEILATLPADISMNESSRLASEYTEAWIKHQLVLEKAKLNIGNDTEINALVEEYRDQLLIETYLQLLVEKKADIKPTSEEIVAFYEETKENYILPENLLKGIFIILPQEATDKEGLMEMLKSEEIDQASIEAYCLQNAAKVDFFLDKWTAFRLMKKHLPEIDQTEKKILTDHKIYEAEDSLFQYIIKIDEHKLIGSNSPLDYIYNELEEFILTKNKVSYLQKMEKNLYDDAIRKGLIQYNK